MRMVSGLLHAQVVYVRAGAVPSPHLPDGEGGAGSTHLFVWEGELLPAQGG